MLPSLRAGKMKGVAKIRQDASERRISGVRCVITAHEFWYAKGRRLSIDPIMKRKEQKEG